MEPICALTISLAAVGIIIAQSHANLNYSPIFRHLLLFMDPLAGAVGVLICLLALLSTGVQVEPRRWALLLADRVGAVATISFIVLCTGSWFVYRHHPLSMDEYAAVFQSRIFAAGQLIAWFPPPLVDWLIAPPFTDSFLTASETTGAVVSGYWPGHSLLMAPFALIGAPWMLNPLLAAISLCLLATLAREITGSREAAGWAILLTLASPAYSVNAISFYAMPAHLTLNAAFACLLIRPSVRRCLVAGAIGSLALVLHNPMPHLLFALPWLLTFLFDPARRALLVPLLAAYVPISLGLGVGWAALRASIAEPGGPGTEGIARSSFTEYWLARLQEVFAWPDLQTLGLMTAYFAKLTIWASPGMLVMAAIGAIVLHRQRNARVLLWSLAVTASGYLIFGFDQGHGWGYRYLHSAWLVFPILAAGALTAQRPMADESRRRRFGMALCLGGIMVLTPVQWMLVGHFVREQITQLPPATRSMPTAVFVNYQSGFYTADLIQNDPLLRSSVIYLASYGHEADERLRAVWFPGARLLTANSNGSVWAITQPLVLHDERRKNLNTF